MYTVIGIGRSVMCFTRFFLGQTLSKIHPFLEGHHLSMSLSDVSVTSLWEKSLSDLNTRPGNMSNDIRAN